MDPIENYTTIDHLHNYAIWAAATAARRGASNNNYLTNQIIFDAINNQQINLKKYIKEPDKLLIMSFDEMKIWHREIRKKFEKYFKTIGKDIAHGKIAKVINVYLKTIILCNLSNLDMLTYIHPPLDNYLLNEWKKNTKYQEIKDSIREVSSWSNLSSTEYESLIDHARKELGDCTSLWKLEHYWTIKY